MSDTPNPPADTRQQAVAAWHGLSGPEQMGVINTWTTPDAWRSGYAAALASSSPALPEPPAPTLRPNDISRWVLAQNAVLAAPATSYRDDPWVHDGYNDMTPAEARLLASTLLAAADVAEGGA